MLVCKGRAIKIVLHVTHMSQNCLAKNNSLLLALSSQAASEAKRKKEKKLIDKPPLNPFFFLYSMSLLLSALLCCRHVKQKTRQLCVDLLYIFFLSLLFFPLCLLPSIGIISLFPGLCVIWRFLVSWKFIVCFLLLPSPYEEIITSHFFLFFLWLMGIFRVLLALTHSFTLSFTISLSHSLLLLILFSFLLFLPFLSYSHTIITTTTTSFEFGNEDA